MIDAMLMKEAFDLSLEIAVEIPPGLGGAIDFVQAVKARSLYGMFTSAAEFFADFIPGGKLVHVLEKAPKLAVKLKRLREIFAQFERLLGISILEGRGIKKAAEQAQHHAHSIHSQGLHLPPGYSSDRWTASFHSLSGKAVAGGSFKRQLDHGIAVESIRKIDDPVQMSHLNRLAREMASMLASKDNQLAELLLKMEKRGIKVHLHINEKGQTLVVYSAGGVADVSFLIPGGLDGAADISIASFARWTGLALPRLPI